jgi:putative glutamine amidotransferase
MRPLIGITTYLTRAKFGAWEEDSALVPADYVRAVERAGGRALLVPPSDDGVEETLDALDGIVFSGGSDLDPATYGQEPHEATYGIVEARDRAELALLQAALARDLPVLAVCRGLQLLNVAYGGDLVQHLDEGPHQPEPGRWGRHPVQASGGRLLELAGADPQSVPSYHHQALGRLGDGLVATAEAPDGLVEAVEDPARGFCLGIMWHPDEDVAGGLPLFRALVEAARAHAPARPTANAK